ncbi:hypothetical protein [Streptomyces uncialis]|uniref:hypothetical protein n=1 Tax=Streptomyces uncialis TaxID=1048205 RepID=UPI0034051A1F
MQLAHRSVVAGHIDRGGGGVEADPYWGEVPHLDKALTDLIGGHLGLAEGTVRGWLRAFAGRAEAVRRHFTITLVADDLVMPDAAPSTLADAVSAVAASPSGGCDEVAAHVHGVAVGVRRKGNRRQAADLVFFC